MKNLILPLTCLLFWSCSTGKKDQPQQNTPDFVQSINTHHKKEKFKQAGVFTANIELSFGGKQRLNARMLYNTQTQETALFHSDGRSLVFTQDTVWMSPDTTQYPSARFDIFTWSYFMALPYKLNDKGLEFEIYENNKLAGKTYNTQHLSFQKNVGDAPEDWYILYQDKKSGLLHAAAYIVTLNKTKSKAEEDPHAILYKDFKEVDGIPMASRWEFYSWRKEKGLTQKLGEATLSNLQFVEADEAMFKPPLPKKEVKL